MKKNLLKFYFLTALLFVANPGLVLAEELAPNEPVVSTIETITTTDETASTTPESMTPNDETATSTQISSSTLEASQNVSFSNFSSENSSIATNTISVNLNIRYQDSVVFSGPVTLINDATTTVIDNTNTNREIIVSTALGALNQADIDNTSFNISNLAYYASWNAFLINCLDVATSTNLSLINACYNWQYVVNDIYPFVGADQYNLSDGDNIYFYFGSPRIVELSTSTISAGDSFIATAKSYDYQNNLYVPAPNYTIGITQPDPNNPWSPTVLFSTTSDSLGQGIFTLNQIGSYGIGLAEDYYYSLQNLSVVATSTTATSTNSTSGSSANSSVNINQAIEFLMAQTTDGSFGSDLYTDWVAIGLAASGNSSAKNLVKNYLLNQKFSADNLTDYERRAMALMSLGINPYNGTNINYIEKIIEGFDGNQFGEEGLVNDDIFALFPLLNAGYNSSDPEISKTVAFIISKQNSNGSWDSIDLTAAAIQALSLVSDLPNVNSALEKAKTYLNNSKQGDGGFGNIFSTLWAKQALNDNSSDNYLASKQNSDGGLETGSDLNSRIWATAYLIPAYYGKSWNSLMSNFKKLKIETSADNTSDNSFDKKEVSNQEVVENNEPVADLILPEVVEKPFLALENNVPEVKESFNSDVDNPKDEIENQNNLNLQANVLGSFENLPIIKTFNEVIITTFVGLKVVWSFITGLFKI